MRLCLISCNIRFENPDDGPNSWPHRKGVLKSTLLSHLPDLIATQEGRFPQLKSFEKLLSGYKLIDHHRSWIHERMYPSFFLKENKFELLDSNDHWLSDTPDVPGSMSFNSLFPRLMTWIKIRPLNSSLNFLVINTHFDHLEEMTRIGQMNVFIQEIKKIWDQHSHMIIMGDFNDSPISEIRKRLLTSFSHIIDPWSLFNQFEQTSHHPFSGEFQNGSRIDWILTDKNLTVENCFMDKSMTNGRYPSDHFPIICHINI